MRIFEGKRVVLGVSGGIAAYKAIEICRRLVDAGAYVQPVLTKGALRFVGETTFSALGSERAQTSLFDGQYLIPHTRLGQGADVIVVAPATARILASYAHGLSNDLLTTTLISTDAPVVLAPAMHTEMWRHPAIQENIAILAARGVHIVPPESGRLAGGDIGEGRLSSLSKILDATARAITPQDCAGLHIVVTAGGTREPIDPVRFLSNRSSGKQGHAIAHAATLRGARVTLITTEPATAPENLDAVVAVNSADDMHTAVGRVREQSDVIVMAAAVADFTPVTIADCKIKKLDGIPNIVLKPTVDILAELGATKRPGQTLVGFAAETNNVAEHARNKLVNKNLDLIVANDVSAEGVGFEYDTNAVTIFRADGETIPVDFGPKPSVAHEVLSQIIRYRGNTQTNPQ